jgi:hypothetical protein
MTLQRFEKTLALNKLYGVSASATTASDEFNPSIWVNSGSVDIYCSDSATKPTALSTMTLNLSDTAISGKNVIECLGSYISLKQNIGTSTEIIISGVDTQDLGAIS